MDVQTSTVDDSDIDNDLESEGRDSTRPIRALNRGLDVLTALNRLERAAINTLANAVELPRTTTYRILETLRLAGYVERDAHDDCYRPTIMVRALSDGFDDEAMVAHIAKPHLAALCTQIVWPVAIAYYETVRLLAAWCELREDFRHFRTDHMRAQ